MKSRIRIPMIGLLTFSLLVWIAVAADVSGTWKGTLTFTNSESRPITFNLHENAGVVTGTVGGIQPDGPVQTISNGKVIGDQISFDATGVSDDGSTSKVGFSGTVSGNQIQGALHTRKGDWKITVTKQ